MATCHVSTKSAIKKWDQRVTVIDAMELVRCVAEDVLVLVYSGSSK